MQSKLICLVIFLTTVLPSALMLVVLIGVPVYAFRWCRRETVFQRRALIVLGSAFAIPILLLLSEGISMALLFALRVMFGGD